MEPAGGSLYGLQAGSAPAENEAYLLQGCGSLADSASGECAGNRARVTFAGIASSPLL
jgi:hypothetical protein